MERENIFLLPSSSPLPLSSQNLRRSGIDRRNLSFKDITAWQMGDFSSMQPISTSLSELRYKGKDPLVAHFCRKRPLWVGLFRPTPLLRCVGLRLSPKPTYGPIEIHKHSAVYSGHRKHSSFLISFTFTPSSSIYIAHFLATIAMRLS